MKIIIISPKNKTLYNFRGDLIKAIINKEHEVIAIGPNKDHMEDVLNLGVSFIEIPFSKDNTSILGDLKYFNNLKRVISSEKPDLIFSYTIKPVIYGSLAAKFAGVEGIYPMVTGLGRVYSSNTIKSRLLKNITGTLYKLAFKNSSRVIFQNSDDLNEFVSLNYVQNSKAVKIDGSGVNMSLFNTDDHPKSPVFLMISRIIKEKGVIEYAEAARKIKTKYPKARFILLGGYDDSIGAIKPEEIRPYIEEGSIEYPGEVDDVKPFLRKATAYILPTYYREGLPRTILEAMSMGKPIITTDWPGCRDAVINGFNGYLIEPKNSEEIVDKVELLINNSQSVTEMGLNSYNLCKERYDVNIVNKKMLNIMGIY